MDGVHAVPGHPDLVIDLDEMVFVVHEGKVGRCDVIGGSDVARQETVALQHGHRARKGVAEENPTSIGKTFTKKGTRLPVVNPQNCRLNPTVAAPSTQAMTP